MMIPSKRKSGQAMMEYIVTMLMSLGLLVMVLLLYYVFKEFGGRIVDLASSEYP